jgi:ABC-type sugar transport system permease subunit
MRKSVVRDGGSIQLPLFSSISLLLLPSVVILVLITGIPLVHSFVLSLHRWNLITPSRLVGLSNYSAVLQDGTFHQAIRVTLLVAALSLLFQSVLAYLTSQLLNHPAVRHRAVWHAVLILPYMLTPIVIAMMWRAYLNLDFGIANVVLEFLGVQPRPWASAPDTALLSLVFVEVWHKTSFLILIFSAGMASLPRDVFEAADIDGANYWTRTFLIQLPMLKAVLRVGVLFQAIELIRLFDKPYLLTEGGPGRITTTLSLAIFQRSFHAWQIGRASAMSYVMMAIMGVVCGVLLLGLRKESES